MRSHMFLVLTILGGCATQNPTIILRCPINRTETPAAQRALSSAMKSLPPNGEVVGALLDRERMRCETDRCDGTYKICPEVR